MNLSTDCEVFPGGGGDSYEDGSARRKVFIESLRGTKTLFCGHGLKCFSPLRGNHSYTNQHLLSYCFRLNNLNSTANAAVERLRLNTLRCTATVFFTPASTPVFFAVGVPPGSLYWENIGQAPFSKSMYQAKGQYHHYVREISKRSFILRLGLPSTLICHENGAFQKRSSNQRNLKTPTFRFCVDGTRFER